MCERERERVLYGLRHLLGTKGETTRDIVSVIRGARQSRNLPTNPAGHGNLDVRSYSPFSL